MGRGPGDRRRPALTGAPAPAPQRRCRGRRRREPGELRPTDVVGAFFVLGLAFLAAGVAAAVVDAIEPWAWGRWLALHLAFVGGVSQLVLGASQFFSGAFLATDPPPRALVRAQLATWNLGSILLAVAVPGSTEWLIELAVALLLGGLALYVTGLARMRRRSLNRIPWATRWYAAAAILFGLGIFAGATIARGGAWAYGDLLAAHMALNLGGWFGTAIVGTLHTFYPSLTGTELAYPRLQPWTIAAWVAGVAATAAGYAWSLDWLAVAGWLSMTIAALLLAANVLACSRRAPAPVTLAARLVGTAQAFLVAGLLVSALAAIEGGPSQAIAGGTRAAVGTLLVAGWIGLTVLGSLLQLLSVMLRVRDLRRPMPVARPALDLPLVAVAGLAVAGVALGELTGASVLRTACALALLAVYALLGARVAGLGALVLTRARPSV